MAPRAPEESLQVTPAPLPSARLTAAPGPEAFGANLGSAIERAGFELHEKATREADQTALVETDTRYSKLATDLQLKARNLQGKDAMGAPELVQKGWQDGLAEIDKTIPNDRVRLAAQGRAALHYDQLYKTTMLHVDQQRTAYQDQTDQAGIQQAIDVARLNAVDPQAVENAHHTITGIVADRARRNGVAGTPIHQEETRKAYSALYQNVIESALDTRQPALAKSYLDKYGPYLSTDAQHTVTTRLKATANAQQGAIVAQQVWDEHMKDRSFNDPVPVFDMQEAIRKSSGSDTDVRDAALNDLAHQMNAWNAQQREQATAAESVVRKREAEGATLGEIRALPEFQKLLGQQQYAIVGPLQAKQDKLMDEMNKAQSANLILAAVQAGTDPKAQAPRLTDIKRFTEHEAAANHFTPQWTEAALRERTEAVHSGIVLSLLSQGKSAEAQAYVERQDVQQVLAPDVKAKLHASIRHDLAATEGGTLAQQAWQQFGGKPDKEVEMRQYLADHARSPETQQAAAQALTQFEQARDRQQKAVYKAQETDVNTEIQQRRVTSVAALRRLPAFQALTPKDQHEAETYLTRQDLPLSASEKQQQEVTWGRLYSDPEALRTANLESLLRQRQVSESAYKQLIERRASQDQHDPETRQAQALRYGALRRDPIKLATADLDGELQSGALNENQYQRLTQEQISLTKQPVDAQARAKQFQTFETLLRDPKALASANLPDMVKAGTLDEGFAKELARLRAPRQPLKDADVTDSLKRLDEARTKRLFVPTDEGENLKKWQEARTLVRDYVSNHHGDLDYDPKAFTDKILAPLETTWVDTIYDLVSPGQPGSDRRRAEKLERLRQEAGRGVPAPAPPSQTPSTGTAHAATPSAPAFNQLPSASANSGKVFRDTVTGQRFKSDGKSWQKVP